MCMNLLFDKGLAVYEASLLHRSRQLTPWFVKRTFRQTGYFHVKVFLKEKITCLLCIA